MFDSLLTLSLSWTVTEQYCDGGLLSYAIICHTIFEADF